MSKDVPVFDNGKNIFKFDGDEKLLKSYIDKSPLACLIFSAAWCPSCRRLSQQINQIALNYPKVLFVNIDVQASQNLTSQFGIVKIPTTKFCRVDDNKIVEAGEVVGASSTRFKEKLSELVPGPENNNANEEAE